MDINEKINSKYNILLVDDNFRNVELLDGLLQADNMLLFKAYNGKDALRIAIEQDLDLILLDVLMPEMTGFEVCQRLKSDFRTKHIPIIFLTARTDTSDIVKGFQLGAVDYITKPFNPLELCSRVQTHLELKRSHDIISLQYQQLDQQNKRLDEQNQELRELNATKDKFFNIIARDLKEPFSVLIGSSNLLMDRFDVMDPEKIKRFNQLIHNSSQSGYNLLENLLEWAKSQSGTMLFNPQVVSCGLFAEVVQREYAILKVIAKNKNVRLIFDFQLSEENEELPLLFADLGMFKAIIRNLLSNAVRYAPNGGEVCVSTRFHTNENKEQFTEITVSDTGMGIKDEDISKLFRIDVRRATIGTSSERGTGLGLILCKEFVDKNGGRIWVESQYGKGCHFKFTLPSQSFPAE